MSKSVLQFVVGLVIGIALVMLVETMGDTAESQSQMVDPSVGASLATIEKSLSSIDDSLQIVCRELANLNYSAGATYVAPSGEVGPGEEGGEPTAKREVVPIPTETRVRHVNNRLATNWVEAINASLAQALVEYGLTPYDSGVGVHLRKAAAELKNAQNRNMTRYKEFEKRWSGKNTYASGDDSASLQKNAEREEIKQMYADEKSEAIDAFRKALETLVSGK